MDELIKTKRLHNKILHFFERTGPVRKLEYELLGVLLKSKLINKHLVKTLL